MTMKTQDKTKRNSAAKYLHVNEVDISNPAVRCPVILLLDTSKSMKGQPIKELEDGLCQLITEIQNNITASNSVELSIITLDEHATVQLPFTPAMDLVPRKLGLTAAGGTFTGKALDRAYEQLVARRKQYAENGIFFYAPWVILMSDGKPGDSWQGPAENLLSLVKKTSNAVYWCRDWRQSERLDHEENAASDSRPSYFIPFAVQRIFQMVIGFAFCRFMQLCQRTQCAESQKLE